MRRVRVNTTAPYDVIIGENIIQCCFSEIAECFNGGKLLIVTDSGVPAGIVNTVRQGLCGRGFDVCVHTFTQGEQSKNVQTLMGILSCLADARFTRSDGIVAVGGGVVGDVAGLAASLYMRGIRYVQIPTTFLAAIDSSVGGKTAIDLPQGKNLVGCFYQPSLVVCDVDFFKTLSVGDIHCGIGEGVKYGLLSGGRLWDIISCSFLDEREKALKTHVNGVVEAVDVAEFAAECVSVKADIVSKDEREGGMRKLLNLGHSVGHAIEKLAGYKLPHGVCVAKGTVKILQMGIDVYGGRELHNKVVEIFNAYGIDVSCPYTAEQLVEAMRADKKTVGEEISMIFVQAPGKPIVEKISFDRLGEML